MAALNQLQQSECSEFKHFDVLDVHIFGDHSYRLSMNMNPLLVSIPFRRKLNAQSYGTQL